MPWTPRERWLAMLQCRTPDRIPTDYQATPEVTARLLREVEGLEVQDGLQIRPTEEDGLQIRPTEAGGADQVALWRRLHVDKRKILEPRWTLPHHPGDPRADLWGVRYRKADYGGGSYDEPEFHPLAAAQTVAEIHSHRWPDPDDFDYTTISRAIDEDDGVWPIHAGCYEPFLLYGYLRGLEQAFADLALNPDIADAILGHLFDFHYEHHRRIFEAGRGRILLTWVAEDLGAQHGPLMSLATYRRFLLSNQIQMADLARRYGVHVMYHTDGAARLFLPDLIDRVGIEVLNPIQWRCAGMERERLVADFGQRIIFHGSIDNQQTLAFGTVEDVVEEVRQSVEIYRGARWICAPCHNLQPVSPIPNIVAMYDTIHALGAQGT